jgi:hypothetical protein
MVDTNAKILVLDQTFDINYGTRRYIWCLPEKSLM